jgi:hypothetical protein
MLLVMLRKKYEPGIFVMVLKTRHKCLMITQLYLLKNKKREISQCCKDNGECHIIL